MEWASGPADRYLTSLNLEAKDRVGLLMDVATVMSSLGANVRSVQTITKGEIAYLTISVEVRDAAELKLVSTKLSNVRGVTNVSRSGKAVQP